MDPTAVNIIIFLVCLTLLVFLLDINIVKVFKDGVKFFSCILNPFCTDSLNWKVILNVIKKSLLKLNPLYTLKNPIVFIVEVGAIIITAITFSHAIQYTDYSFNLQLSIWLWISVFCSNFVETLAQYKHSEQNEQQSKTKIYVNRIAKNGKIENVPVLRLRKGDLIVLNKNDTVPCDGELFTGIALIDESAVIGESVPVVKEADTERNKILKGTKVLYGNIKLKITTNQAVTLIDEFLRITEPPKKLKTPDESAVDATLIGLAIVFLGIIIILVVFADYSKVIISTSALIALFVCLLPTTIGGLLPAIGPSSVEEFSKNNFPLSCVDKDKSCDNIFPSYLQKHSSGNDFSAQTTKSSNFFAQEQSSVVSYVDSGIKEESNIFKHKNLNMKFGGNVIRAEAPVISDFGPVINFEYLLTIALNILGLSKQILATRGNLVMFSVAYDVSKYFAVIPALCASQHPISGVFNVIQLASIKSAVLSVVMFNALIIFLLIPFVFRESVKSQPGATIKNNIKTYGFLGVLLPFIGIKLVNILVVYFHWA